MKVKVTPLRECGRNIVSEKLKEAKSIPGELEVGEERDPALSRAVMRARLLDTTRAAGHEVLPQLRDARLIWLGKDAFRLAGTERRDGVEYAQTWEVAVETAEGAKAAKAAKAGSQAAPC